MLQVKMVTPKYMSNYQFNYKKQMYIYFTKMEDLLMKYKNEIFENIIFEKTENDYKQCKFINCDFSNSIYSKYISKGNEYINTKFIGANMMESHLENVTFKECILRYSNFSECALNKVDFFDCDMSESNFINLKAINKLTFDNCKLIRADFRETKLDKLDFRTCDISGIMVKIEDLRGLIVNSYQAITLSAILGLKIKD